jgi:hypothetical protein
MGRYRRHYRSRYRDLGIERAMQHIREAEELSRELGGTDADVKEYFFSLPPCELAPILDAYEKKYGREARRYAEETIPAWRLGRRKMSGQNASRLFHLLPRFMPLERKYSLIESLWTKFAPRSEYSVSFGHNADAHSIKEIVGKHLNATVNEHSIPGYLQRRFEWLADGDSVVKQQLLNHILMCDRQQAIEISAAIVNLILPHAQNGTAIQSFRRDLKIGGHTVHVFLDPRATEVKLTPGGPRFIGPPNYSWVGGLVFVAVIIGLIWLITSNSSKKESREPRSPTINKQRR